MEKNDVLNEEKSLDIITEMINRAKGNIQSEYVFFLIWGWIIALASLANFYLLRFTSYEHPWQAWYLIGVGVILSIWYGYRLGKKAKVKTYTDKIYGQLWLAFLVGYFIVLFFMKDIDYKISPIIMILAGTSTYMSGIVIKFKPLVYGGILLWLTAVINFLIPADMQLLVNGVSIMIGYLVPGYMLKNKTSHV